MFPILTWSGPSAYRVAGGRANKIGSPILLDICQTATALPRTLPATRRWLCTTQSQGYSSAGATEHNSIYHTFIPHVSLGIFMLFCRNVGKNIVGGYQCLSSSGVSGGCWDNPLSSWQKPRWEVDLFSYFRQMYAKTLLLFWCGIRIHLGDIQIHK